MPIDDVRGPYSSNIETFRGGDHYQMTDAYVQIEPQQLPQTAVSQQSDAPPHTTLAVQSVLDEDFPNLWIGRCCPAGCPAGSLNAAQ